MEEANEVNEVNEAADNNFNKKRAFIKKKSNDKLSWLKTKFKKLIKVVKIRKKNQVIRITPDHCLTHLSPYMVFRSLIINNFLIIDPKIINYVKLKDYPFSIRWITKQVNRTRDFCRRNQLRKQFK